MPKAKRKRLSKRDVSTARRLGAKARLSKGGILVADTGEKPVAVIWIRRKPDGFIEHSIPVFALDDKHLMRRLNNYGPIDPERFEVDMGDIDRVKHKISQVEEIKKQPDDFFWK